MTTGATSAQRSAPSDGDLAGLNLAWSNAWISGYQQAASWWMVWRGHVPVPAPAPAVQA
jgi:hypothetical protein